MSKISRIYEALLNRKEKVCHRSEIVEIIREYKKEFSSSLSTIDAVKYLSRHGYIKRIFAGYFYINSVDERRGNYCIYEDRELLFIVLNKLNVKWYIGFSSANYLAGNSWSVPRTLHILNSKFSGTRRILSLNVSFHKLNEALFFGAEKRKTNNNIRYFYSEPAKTALDMVYFGVSKGFTRNEKIMKYLERYPKWMQKST
ncbi:hypothetical protein JXA85_03865 [Candidatus Woesearchaeota archaeon]|nr:hypothetical protein [Candidatus Woesearchaeota archaeon]